MSFFIPCTAGFTTATQAITHERYWRVLIDTNDDDVLEDVTDYLFNNEVSGGGQLEGTNNEAVASSRSVRLRNSQKLIQEGAYAGAAAAIEAKAGAGNEYIRVFTGYVDDKGAVRAVKRLSDDTITLTFVDGAKRGITGKKCDPVYLVNYKICDPATPAASIFHQLAFQLGLTAADLICGTIDHVKDVVGYEKSKNVWKELQELAAGYLGMLRFRYDGKLLLSSRFETGYTNPTSEWTFNDDNFFDITLGVSPVLCNKVKTEYDDMEAMSSRVIHKNVEGYIESTGKISIEVEAGAYWPGPGAADVGILGFTDPTSGEEWETVTNRVTPTIGADGSGSDIECSGGLLTLESFDGVAGTTPAKTSREYRGSQIILYNGTGSAITITRFELRGEPVRVTKAVKVEDIDDAITNDWEFKEKDVPGRYMVNEVQAHATTQWWMTQGKARRREFKGSTYWMPQIQEGAIVTFESASLGISATLCQVIEYKHPAGGSPATWRTTLTLREWEAFTPTGSGLVETTPIPTGGTEAGGNTMTTTQAIEGFTTGGGTKTPTKPTIAFCYASGKNGISLIWDRQNNLTNPDHYEIQVSDDAGIHVYAVRQDGVDWKGTENSQTSWPVEFFTHAHIPPAGTTDAPTGRLLYYRVRRVTKAPLESDWSDWSVATTDIVGTGDIAENAVTLNKLAAAVISVMLLKAGVAYFNFQSFTGSTTLETPGPGDTVIRVSSFTIEFLEYTSGGWNVTANGMKIGGFLTVGAFSFFLNMVACGGCYHPANPPTTTEQLPNPAFRVFNFENDYDDQDGVDDWTTKTNLSFSSTIKKFGSYSLFATAGNVGTLAGMTSIVFGNDQAWGTWFAYTITGGEDDPSSALQLLDATGVLDMVSIYLQKKANSNICTLHIYVNKNGSLVWDYTGTTEITQSDLHYAGIVYKASTDIIFLVLDNNIIASSALGGSWAGNTAGLRLNPRNAEVGAFTRSIWYDELLYFPNKYLDPNVLAQHYTHDLPWDTKYSKLDFPIIPGLGGRVMIGQPDGGIYPMGLKPVDSAALTTAYQAIAHGLGVVPGREHLSIVCIIAEQSFSIGDEVVIPFSYEAGGNYYVYGLSKDAINYYIMRSTSVAVARKDTGATALLTLANWKWRIRCGV